MSNKSNIAVSQETRNMLNTLKYVLNCKNLDEVIKLLYNVYTQVRGIKNEKQ